MRERKTITYEHIDTLNDIQKYLVLPISNTLRPPRHGIRHGHRWADLDLELMRLLGDVFLQDLALGRLRVSEIHHFVHELVDDDKIVAYTFLL